MDGQRATPTMDGRDQQQRQHHGMHQHPMHHPPPAIYGYPVDPSWGAHAMMHAHHMHPGHGYPHPMQHHMEGVPLPPGIPGLGASTDPLEAVLGPFPCARLRNLPFDATLEDILVLFQGLVVIDVVLIGAGEAFVIFANPMDYQMALQRDRQTIGRSFVQIYHGSRSEYYTAIATQQWQEQQRDPPLQTGEPLVGDDKEQNGADASGVWGSVGAPTPVQALNTQAAKPDGNQRRGGGGNGGSGGGSNGGGGSGPPAGAAANSGRGGGASRGNAAGAAPMKRSGGGIQVGEHTGFLRMRGLPFSASKEDISKFFSSYNAVLDTIVLTYRSDGRATGEAYVGFESADDSKRAMELHRKTMGSRYIELFISNKEEHGRAFARFSGR